MVDGVSGCLMRLLSQCLWGACSRDALIAGGGGSGACSVPFAQVCDAPAQSYAEGRCPGVGGIGALRHQAEVEAVVACAIELTPTIHGDVTVAAGEVDFDTVGRGEGLQITFVGGLGGVAVLSIVIVDVIEHSPATAPLGCCGGVGAATVVGCFHDDDVAAALDALRAGEVQGGLQAFSGVAHAPAFDDRCEAGGGQGGQYGQDGHGDHQLYDGEAALGCGAGEVTPQAVKRARKVTDVRRVHVLMLSVTECFGLNRPDKRSPNGDKRHFGVAHGHRCRPFAVGLLHVALDS